MGKLKRISSLFIVFLLIFSCSFSSYADVASGSDAIMTLDLDDEDYGVSVASSVASVSSTISWDNVRIMFRMYYKDNPNSYIYRTQSMGGTNSFSWDTTKLSKDIVVDSVYLRLYKDAIPPVGKYRLQFDYASDNGVTWNLNKYYVKKSVDNANAVDTNWTGATLIQESGDCYWETTTSLPSCDYIDLGLYCTKNVIEGAFGGIFNVAFTPLSSDTDINVNANPLGNNEQDYQNDVSSSLSDLSSSVGSMSEDLSSAAENLEYISTSQNLIIQGIDNVIMHISDQLYAYWDQHFNLIHLPEMDKMDEIIDAIENIDLEVNVNLDKLKSSIDTMNTDIQNKLQSTTDKITSGYDSSGLEAENSELSGAVTEYDQAEQEVMDSVTGNIESFEYPDVETMPGGILAALSFFGGFMQSCFANMGDFNIVITLSLTMIFVLILVGYHRIRT